MASRRSFSLVKQSLRAMGRSYQGEKRMKGERGNMKVFGCGSRKVWEGRVGSYYGGYFDCLKFSRFKIYSEKV
jgi:hypothetical protein